MTKEGLFCSGQRLAVGAVGASGDFRLFVESLVRLGFGLGYCPIGVGRFGKNDRDSVFVVLFGSGFFVAEDYTAYSCDVLAQPAQRAEGQEVGLAKKDVAVGCFESDIREAEAFGYIWAYFDE